MPEDVRYPRFTPKVSVGDCSTGDFHQKFASTLGLLHLYFWPGAGAGMCWGWCLGVGICP